MIDSRFMKPGKEADLLVMDAPPGSQEKTALETIEFGDMPFMGMVMVDGKEITRTMKRALTTAKKVLINGQEDTRKIAEGRYM